MNTTRDEYLAEMARFLRNSLSVSYDARERKQWLCWAAWAARHARQSMNATRLFADNIICRMQATLHAGNNPVIVDASGKHYEVTCINSESVGLHDIAVGIDLRFPLAAFKTRLTDGRIVLA